MGMNYHPIISHFVIGFLSLQSPIRCSNVKFKCNFFHIPLVLKYNRINFTSLKTDLQNVLDMQNVEK